MTKKLTTPEWIFRARAVHGDRYDYSQAEYVGANAKITIICPEHGEISIIPRNHINTLGCQQCGYARTGDKLRKPLDTFVAESIMVHGDRYDYSKAVYSGNDNNVAIICPKHGKFDQTPTIHLRGSGCPTCGNTYASEKQRKSQHQFIADVKVVHGDRYDYSKAEYAGANEKITIICPKHGEFAQTPTNHLSGQGCRSCGYEKIGKSRQYDTSEFIAMAVEKHGGIYDYCKTAYIDSETPVTIGCPMHGEYNKRPNKHLCGQGCPICSRQQISEKMTSTNIEFIEKSSAVHGDVYDYSRVSYVNNITSVTIVCPDHGPYNQLPAVHLRGSGCQKCSGLISKPELEIFEYLSSIGDGWEQHDRTIIGPQELDMINHSLKLAVEYNGLYWHGQNRGRGKNYHVGKLDRALAKGYRLITIFENEWIDRPEVVKARLSAYTGGSPRGAGGRKLTMREISWTDAKIFLDQYHTQKAGVPTKIRIGAFDNETLVGVMTFGGRRAALGSSGKMGHELVRYCSDRQTHAGMASRLFKYAFVSNEMDTVVSYADRRWSIGSLYENIGFSPAGQSAPNYWYFKPGSVKLYHRYGFRKNVLVEKYGADPELSEWRNMKLMGYDRIWDCGNLKYEYTGGAK